MADRPEPWLRGPLADVHLLVQPVLFSFAQVREDLSRHMPGLSDRQVWTQLGRASLGFHLRHIAGSVDRLSTYLIGGQLSEQQLRFLRDERTPAGTIAELTAGVDVSLAFCEERLRELNPAEIFEPRNVGRQRLPTTVVGLLVHLAEHTQRHLGQAITLSQVLRQLS